MHCAVLLQDAAVNEPIDIKGRMRYDIIGIIRSLSEDSYAIGIFRTFSANFRI